MSNQSTAQQAPPDVKYRSNYLPSAFAFRSVDLHFELEEKGTTVHATIAVERVGEASAKLELVGEHLETLGVWIDDVELTGDEYRIEGGLLVLEQLPAAFILKTRVFIHPEENTSCSGLYRSSDIFCTQCEAEGFRRITWFLDRPDVMAVYGVTIDARPDLAPVMLSNGNKVSSEPLSDGRVRVRWEDPHPKPSYLFALVAGDLACEAGTFTTASGREVALEVWVEPRNKDACAHALQSLKDSMRWDEETFGLEYDLDIYMIVAVGDFNMGAMENKGLNVFNSKFVLAKPETATDDEYEGVQAVIGHEYFHNWTGNRVTCKDWFQLTLKEGLTVYRDRRFTSDMTSEPVKRIEDVRLLRNRQFPEDAGPLSHPIRPESYVAMDNFYTATVYEKGAEVVGMYETLLGRDGFRKGMDLYIERHDGMAVSCDDFRAAMADSSGRNLDQFEQWYLQPGTPRLKVTEEWNEQGGSFSLTLEQSPGATAPQDSPPLHMPVRVGLLAPNGDDLPMALVGCDDAPTERVLELTTSGATFTFTGLKARPVASVLRRFSAPVLVEHERQPGDLEFCFANDGDSFNRWEAGQTLARTLIMNLVEDLAVGRALALEETLVSAFRSVVTDPRLDGSMRALMLGLPTEHELAQTMDVVDPDALFVARRFVRTELGKALLSEFKALHAGNKPSGAYQASAQEISRRRAQHAALGYIVAAGEGEALALRDFESADNMSDSAAALQCLVQVESSSREAALADFYKRWKDEPLVLDRWFRLQATCRLPLGAKRAAKLIEHPDFDLANPNRARSVLHAFTGEDPTGFHADTGDGYRLIAEYLVKLDKMNPQVASRLAGSFSNWRSFNAKRQAAAEKALQFVLASDPSRNVREVVERMMGT
ncbi:MAG: aminopeptidase N [Planctomycetota bacterium]|nr:aminopeptidase N [Planctomycetota bacterium]